MYRGEARAPRRPRRIGPGEGRGEGSGERGGEGSRRRGGEAELVGVASKVRPGNRGTRASKELEKSMFVDLGRRE